MKRIVGMFIVLLFLFSACGTPVVTVTAPATQVQHTQTPSPIVALAPSLRPTSTLDEFNQENKDQYGWFRFCQVEPKSAWLGSTVNVSVFGMPANDLVTIYLYDHQEMANMVVTDSNGYVNADITIPADADPGTYMVIVDGTGATTDCLVWLWSEEYLPTYYAGLTKTVTPTLSIDQFAITATQEVLHGKLIKYCKYDQARGFRFSPDGQWVEVVCSSDTMVIVRLDETQKWEVSSATLVNPYAEYFFGVNHWSNDGAYAYINFDPHTDGYWEPFHQGIVLYRLNLETGQISEVLPLDKSNWRIFYSYAFSPNDRRLAYIVTDKSPVILNIRDMQTGAEQSIEFDPKYNTGGGFVWSPDSQKLVFSIGLYPGGDDFITSILLWDKDTSQITELITNYQGELRVKEWINETKIALDAVIVDQGQLKTRKYELDLTNNKLTELNP